MTGSRGVSETSLNPAPSKIRCTRAGSAQEKGPGSSGPGVGIGGSIAGKSADTRAIVGVPLMKKECDQQIPTRAWNLKAEWDHPLPAAIGQDHAPARPDRDDRERLCAPTTPTF